MHKFSEKSNIYKKTQEVENNNESALKDLNPNKIAIPIAVGLLAVLYLIFTSDNINFDRVLENLKNAKLWWIGAAFAVLLLRDLGYMYRIRYLTNRELSWKSSLYTILLWEFSSAITPSVVGGTAVAIFIINKEGVAFGKSLAYVILTAVLDNLFFVFASLFVIFFVPFSIFPDGNNTIVLAGYALSLQSIFTISVSLIAVYTFFMAFGLFVKPKAFRWMLIKLTSFRLFKRWEKDAAQTGDDMILASEILRGNSLNYWLKAILSTMVVWSARYFMLNCLIAAFADLNGANHLLIFCRQIIMWIIMLISPTPGSSGTAEWSFQLFFNEFFQSGFVLIVAILWRLITYYAYLIIGVVAVPRWLARVIKKN